MRSLFIVTLVAILAGCNSKPQPQPQALAKLKSPQEMQEAFERAATPRAEHRALDPLIGKYTVESTFRFAPDAPTETATGETEFKWILGGHFVEQTYTSTFQGMPFEGKATLGFNNLSGRYESTWVDTMGTQIMKSEGTKDPTGKILTFTGSYYCPITDGIKQGRSVLTIGTDTHTYEMFDVTPDGKEYSAMMITYKKVPEKVVKTAKSKKQK